MRSKFFLLIGVYLLFSFVANAQDKSLADQHAALGDSLLIAFQFDSAIVSFRSARNIYDKQGHPASTVRMIWKEASAQMSLARYDTVSTIIQSAISLANNELDSLHVEVGHALNILASNHYLTGNTLKARELFKRSYRILSKRLIENDGAILEVAKNLAICELQLGNYAASLQMLKRVLESSIELNGELHQNTASAYNDLGSVYFYMSDNENAIIHFQKSLMIKTKVLGPEHPSLSIQYNNIGACYGELGDYVQSEQYLLKGLKIDSVTLGPEHPEIANAYNNLGANYGLLEQYDKMLHFYLQALNVRLKNYGEHHPLIIVNYNNLGKAYAKLGQYQMQYEVLVKALRIAKALDRLDHPISGSVYNNLAQYYKVIGNYPSALEYVHKSIEIYAPDFNDPDPKVRDFSKVTHKSKLLHALNTKGEILTSRWENEVNNMELIMSVSNLYDLAIQLISEIRYATPAGQIDELLVETSMKVYYNALNVNYELFFNYQDPVYALKALNIMEKGKAFQLLMTMKNAHAIKYSGIPTFSMEMETNLRNDLHDIERKIDQTKALGNKINDQLSLEYFSLRRTYDSLIQTFEQEHPRYYDLKYGDQELSFEIIREKMLDDNSALIEYMIASDHTFSFIITKDTLKLIRNPMIKNTSKVVLDFVKSTSNPSLVLDSAAVMDGLYRKNGRLLYNHLIKPVLANISTDVNELIIIPDGLLSYLNFELLPVQDIPMPPINYSAVDFLINHYSVRYLNSIATELNNQPNFPDNYDMLAFAPSAPTSALLTGAGSELKFIEGMLTGSYFLNENATEENFKNYASQHGIIHLATHGIYNDRLPGKTQLIFHAEDSSDNLLEIPEIYALNLNAALIVLSACNTGTGDFKRGEGIISLSRAFFYAGCNGVIASLWQIPDESTEKIMSGFYASLLDKKPPYQALRSAKITYLEEVKDPLYAHPLFWGGMIPIGKTDQVIPLNNSWLSWQWTLIILITSAVVYLVLRGKKKSQRDHDDLTRY